MNNIRTISQLEDLKGINTLSDLSSANIYLEVCKNNDSINSTETYRLSMSRFLELLFNHIITVGNSQWVTLTSTQTITGEKTFNANTSFGDNLKISINTVNNSKSATLTTANIIEGTARKSLWA